MNISRERGGEYPGDLIPGERWAWGPLDNEITRGEHEEERGREERNAERRKKKACS
jgi:hypothetical protein